MTIPRDGEPGKGAAPVRGGARPFVGNPENNSTGPSGPYGTKVEYTDGT